MYSYESVPIDAVSQVRFLQVTGRDEQGYISCSLESGYLQDDGHIALSYVWGNEHPSHIIVVDGQYFWIRSNLWEFLSYTANNSSLLNSLLWIDAICINQDDDQEKEAQISFMGQIFARAEYVISWLSGFSSSTNTFDPNDASFLSKATISCRAAEQYNDAVLGSLLRLVTHEYWSRMWIVQEVNLAKEVRVHWQSIDVPITQLHSLLCTKDLGLPKDTNMRTLLHHQFRRLNFNDEAALAPFTSVINGSYEAQLTKQYVPQSLQHLILQYASQTCSLPNDKVYALMGLAKEKVIPNYADSDVKLLIKVMLCNEKSPDLNMLTSIAKVLNVDFEAGFDLDKAESIYDPHNMHNRQRVFYDDQHQVAEKVELCYHCGPRGDIITGIRGTNIYVGHYEGSKGGYLLRPEVTSAPSELVSTKMLHHDAGAFEHDLKERLQLKYPSDFTKPVKVVVSSLDCHKILNTLYHSSHTANQSGLCSAKNPPVLRNRFELTMQRAYSSPAAYDDYLSEF